MYCYFILLEVVIYDIVLNFFIFTHLVTKIHLLVLALYAIVLPKFCLAFYLFYKIIFYIGIMTKDNYTFPFLLKCISFPLAPHKLLIIYGTEVGRTNIRLHSQSCKKIFSL